MLRINRFIKKDKLDMLLKDPNISKVEIRCVKQRKLIDTSVNRVLIYLKIDKQEYLTFLSVLKQIAINNNDNFERTSTATAVHNGFIKESSLIKFNDHYPMIHLFLSKYTSNYSQKDLYNL